jgi:hypothetical protein
VKCAAQREASEPAPRPDHEDAIVSAQSEIERPTGGAFVSSLLVQVVFWGFLTSVLHCVVRRGSGLPRRRR